MKANCSCDVCKPHPELIKQRDNLYWIGAPHSWDAEKFVRELPQHIHFPSEMKVKWAGPGHYRSDVYIVEVVN